MRRLPANEGFGADMDQLLDISSINGMEELHIDRNELNVDQIEVDLDEDELAEMERIMRTKMHFAKADSSSNSPPVGSGKINIQDVVVDTPPSEFRFVEGTEQEKKMKKLEQ
jgi:hypothetical protein